MKVHQCPALPIEIAAPPLPDTIPLPHGSGQLFEGVERAGVCMFH